MIEDEGPECANCGMIDVPLGVDDCCEGCTSARRREEGD